MLKKVIIVVSVSGLIGVLIWGGINRTMAKTNDSNGSNNPNLNVTSDEYPEGNGAQQRGKGDHESISGEACDESNHQSFANGQINAVYQSVIATFGEIEPFVEIAIAEQRHIDALIKQFNKYDLDILDNPWTGKVPAFDSIEQACQAGVEAEIANAERYNQLFRMTNNFNLTRVFTHLSNASLNSHLPQLVACLL